MAEISARNRNAALIAAAGVGGGLAAYQLWKKSSSKSLRGLVAVVTGGTRGLGLELARQLAAEGCQVAICARDTAELEEVRRQFAQSGKRILAIRCDVSHKDEVDQLIHEVTGQLGGIDILVNNSGIIQVGPLENQRHEDFEEAMRQNFYGHLNPTLAVLPQMRNRRSGSIVNITSIGGKVVTPHLLPYCCSKFAAVALSEGIRIEAAKDGIHVMTVAPSTIRTGSYVNAEFRGDVEAEAAWFGYGEMSKAFSLDTKAVAARIVQGIRRKESRLTLGASAKVAVAAQSIAPGMTGGLLSLVNRYLLPGPTTVKRGATGLSIQRSGKSEAINKLGELSRQEAQEYNQPS